jgi:hypothetical protein
MPYNNTPPSPSPSHPKNQDSGGEAVKRMRRVPGPSRKRCQCQSKRKASHITARDSGGAQVKRVKEVRSHKE